VSLSGLLGWITGHQGSHCVALHTGRAELNPVLALIMGLESVSWVLFLVWYAYMHGALAALWLAVQSFVFWLCFVWLEGRLGLTKRAWIISLAGILLVPVLLASLVWIVLHPISN
jgi:hypothetical protein